MAEITLHHLENSRSLRIAWMLEELGLDYEVREYERHPKTGRAGPELEAVHPLGKFPVVEIDGEVLAESGAILEELVDRFGPGFRPQASEEVRRYRFWLHYAEGSLMPPLLVALILARIRSAPVPFFVKPVTARIASEVNRTYARPEREKHVAFIEASLEGRVWLAGDDFSAADVQMYYPLDALETSGALEGAPRIGDLLARCRARPAFARAVARVGDNPGFGRV